MKKKVSIVMLLFLCLTLFAACGNEDCYQSGSLTVVVRGETDSVYQVDLTKVKKEGGLDSVLDYLVETQKLLMERQQSQYGAFLTKVGTLEQGNGKYILIYTSVEADFDVSAYVQTSEYGNFVLKTSGVGASLMHMQDGCVILLTLGSY